MSEKPLYIVTDTDFSPVLETVFSSELYIHPTLEFGTVLTKINNLSSIRHCSNVDFIIDTTGHLNKNIEFIFKNKIISQYRLSKSLQAMILTKHDIAVPKQLHISNISLESRPANVALISKMVNSLDEQQVLIKEEYGARGIGQLLLHVSDVVTLFENLISQTDKKLLELLVQTPNVKLLGNYNTEEEKNERLKGLVADISNINVQQYLDNIKQEYRVLVFANGGVLVFERKDGVDTGVILQVYTLEMQDIICKLKNVLESIDQIFMSADIYILNDDTMGVFEFSNEFGYKYYDCVKTISKHIEDSILLKIRNLNIE